MIRVSGVEEKWMDLVKFQKGESTVLRKESKRVISSLLQEEEFEQEEEGVRRDYEMNQVGWNLSSGVPIPNLLQMTSFQRSPFSPSSHAQLVIAHVIGSFIGLRILLLFSGSVSIWKVKGLNSMGQILPSSPEEEWSSPFYISCSNVCLDLTLFSFGGLQFVCPVFPSRP